MPDTLIMGHYTAEKVAEGLLIHDVELSKETTKAERPDFLRNLDVDVFATFKQHYDERVAAGKVGAFVLLDHEGPGVGRILNLRIMEKELVGDLLVTNKDVIGMIERGELTERSIEWGWSKTDALLKGVALLPGAFGQDSIGWPDLTVKFTKEWLDTEFQIDPIFKMQTGCVLDTLASDTVPKEDHMPLSKEDLEAIGNVVDARIEAKLAARTESTGDIEADVEKAAAKLTGERDEEIVAMKRKFKIDTYVQTLSGKDVPYTERQLRVMFEKKKTDEGMEEMFKRLSKMSEEDVKMEIERDYETPKLEDELKVEYKNYVTRNPKSTLTEQDYIDVVTMKHKVDLSSKMVHQVL